MGQYRTICVDPPWSQKAGSMSSGGMAEGFIGGVSKSADLPYETMKIDAIKALPISDLAAPDCHLYLWTTNKYLPDAFDVMRAWGFKYSSTQTWGKAMMGGGLGGTFRINCEFFLFGYRGRCDAVCAHRGSWFPWGTEMVNPGATMFHWKRPYDERGKPRHSAKPPEFFEVVEQVSHGPRVEVFARDERVGWDRVGDEVESNVDLVLAAAS